MKNLLLGLLFFFVVTCPYAQESRRGSRFVSFSIGPNFANLLDSKAPYLTRSSFFAGYDYKTSISKDIRIGLNIATGYEYFLRENLSLLFSIRYENKGINLTDAFTRQFASLDQTTSFTVNYSYQIKVDNDYLVTPILVKKYINNTGFYFQGGLYLGLILRSQIQTSYEKKGDLVQEYSYSNINDVKNVHTSDIDFGLSGGFGYSHPLSGKTLLTIDFLLSGGLVKVDKLNNNSYLYLPTGTNSSYLQERNYYGLSSNSRNVSFNLSLGIAHRILPAAGKLK